MAGSGSGEEGRGATLLPLLESTRIHIHGGEATVSRSPLPTLFRKLFRNSMGRGPERKER